MTRKKLLQEVVIVLVVTFGMAGLRSLLRLISSLLAPQPLNEQSTTITAPQSQVNLIDLALQLCSAAVLFAWGFLGLYLLGIKLPKLSCKDWLHGAGLAAVIGLPGLGFYLAAVHFGLSKQVIPSDLNSWWEAPILLIYSGANAFGEEIVVVLWLITRLKQLGLAAPTALGASAVLRGSYHLYQGISAGFGNIIMGIVFGGYFLKTGKIWPLVLGHFLIDAVAFVGYAILGDKLGF